MGPASFQSSWDEAQRIATAAYRAIEPVASKMRRAMRWEQIVQYDFIESGIAAVVSRDTYLVTRTITTPDADYPDLKRWDVVTPGHTWHLRRHLRDEERETLAVSVQIVLTVDREGVARLRSGKRLEPATPEAWSALAAGVLEPRSVRLRRFAWAPLRSTLKIIGMFAAPWALILPSLLLFSLFFFLLKSCG
jgi:hypothetical protein